MKMDFCLIGQIFDGNSVPFKSQNKFPIFDSPPPPYFFHFIQIVIKYYMYTKQEQTVFPILVIMLIFFPTQRVQSPFSNW